MNDERCIFIDLETTSLSPDEARIAEIFAVELDGDMPTGKTFYRLLDPEEDLSDVVKAITGLEDADLKGERKFAEIAPELLDFLGNGHPKLAGEVKLGGHNVEGYDLKVLNARLADCEMPPLRSKAYLAICDRDRRKGFKTELSRTTIDTMQIVGKENIVRNSAGRPKWPSLDESCEVSGLDRSTRTQHGAAIDTMLSVQCYYHWKYHPRHFETDKRLALRNAVVTALQSRIEDVCRPHFRGDQVDLVNDKVQEGSPETYEARKTVDVSSVHLPDDDAIRQAIAKLHDYANWPFRQPEAISAPQGGPSGSSAEGKKQIAAEAGANLDAAGVTEIPTVSGGNEKLPKRQHDDYDDEDDGLPFSKRSRVDYDARPPDRSPSR